MFGNLLKMGRKMVSDAWDVAEGEFKRITNKRALVAFCSVGYMIGVSDYDATEHKLLEDAYDADQRIGTLNLIKTNPATEAFDDDDISDAFSEATKMYNGPVAMMPGHAVKKMGDDKVVKLLKEFAGTDNAEPLMEAACMVVWGDGKIEQGEVDALDTVGSALGYNPSAIQGFKDKFAIAIT